MTRSSGLQNLIDVINAAKNGDLTVRAETTTSTLAPLVSALNQMLEALSQHASQIADGATHTLSTAEALERANQLIAEGVSRQQAAIAEIARKLKALEARSDEIGQIVELFDDVTSETNILALNAAIEASRAACKVRPSAWWPRMCASWLSARRWPPRTSAPHPEHREFHRRSQPHHRGDSSRGRDAGRVCRCRRTRHRGACAAVKGLTQALARLRFAGQDEAELARALRERRAAITDLLQPLRL